MILIEAHLAGDDVTIVSEELLKLVVLELLGNFADEDVLLEEALHIRAK